LDTIAGAGATEEAWDLLRAADLCEEYALALLCGFARDERTDGRFAGPALSCDDDNPFFKQRV